MSFSTVKVYIEAFFPHLPPWHWVALGVLAVVLMTLALIRGRRSVYGAIAMGVAVAMGLAILDALALIRIGGQHKLHPTIDLADEWRRLTSGNEELLALMLFNLAVFVPFGAVLEEAIATASSGKRSMKRHATRDAAAVGRLPASTRAGRWLHLVYVALFAFLLSLCIESLQLLLHIGMFEVTDLVLNTVGAILGGMVAFVLRKGIITVSDDEANEYA